MLQRIVDKMLDNKFTKQKSRKYRVTLNFCTFYTNNFSIKNSNLYFHQCFSDFCKVSFCLNCNRKSIFSFQKLIFKMQILVSLQEVQEIKSDVGELLISLVYNENLSRLTATIIEARRLKVRMCCMSAH